MPRPAPRLAPVTSATASRSRGMTRRSDQAGADAELADPHVAAAEGNRADQDEQPRPAGEPVNARRTEKDDARHDDERGAHRLTRGIGRIECQVLEQDDPRG